jgi:uncharacterized protein
LLFETLLKWLGLSWDAALPGLQIFSTTFLSVLIGAFPFIVVAVLASALIEHVIPRETIARLLPKNRWVALLLAPLVGIVIPMCECGIIPVARRLARKGVPLAVAVAFMLANPIINPLVIFSTYLAFPFDLEILWWRLGLGYLISILAGIAVMIWQRRVDREVLLPDPVQMAPIAFMEGGETTAALQRPRFESRWIRTLQHAGDEFFDVAKYFVLGAFLAASAHAFVDRQYLETVGLHPVSSVTTMMALAFVLSICSEADAFVAASFGPVFTGGSIIAFLVFGPMTDIKNTLMMLSTFEKRFVLYLNLVMAGLALIAGVGYNLLR